MASKCLKRILAVDEHDSDGTEYVDKWTERFKTPDGEWTLRPSQALAFEYLSRGDVSGVVGAITVGGGKTLIAQLGCRAAGVDPDDTLVLAPAELRDEAQKEWSTYREHFEVPRIEYLSYARLSRDSGWDRLREKSPKLLFADEAHYLANLSGSARGTRWMEYMRENPSTTFVPMSGTLTNRSLEEFYHLVLTALRHDAPVPSKHLTRRLWRRAIDANPPAPPDEMVWREVGALADAYTSKDEGNLRQRARIAFQRRFRSTPGVVSTTGSSCSAPITCRRIEADIPDEVDEALERARDVWELPGDEEILDQLRLDAKLKQLAQGFYYRFDWGEDGPNHAWLAARRRFNGRVRQYTKRAKPGRDTAGLVVEALERGDIHFPEWDEWQEWLDFEPPPTETVWISDYLVDDAVDRAGPNTAIWYRHRAVGEKLGERVPTAMGGEPVPDGEVVGLSLSSHGTGLNLQDRFDKYIVLAPPSNGGLWQQFLGRAHRPGFLDHFDELHVDWYGHTSTAKRSFDKALDDAVYQNETQGIEHKLLIAQRTEEV